MRRVPSLMTGSLSLFLVVGLSCGGSGSLTVGDGGTGGAGSGGATGAGADGGTGTGGSGTGTGGASGTGGAAAMGCDVAKPQCSDGIDNDGDGKIDGLDPECVGTCDNDESSFATGIPGDNIDACKQDCFFDGNSGQGDDGCDWNLKCDKANPGAHTAKPCPYDANYKNCPKNQSERCIKNCRKLTPNGCDCFGCCAVTVNNSTATILLQSGCTAAEFGNESKCPRCTQSADCVNTCEKCEICIDKPAPDPSCPAAPAPDGGTPTPDGGTPPDAPPGIYCEQGIRSCGPGGQVPADMCGSGYFCITGCCQKLIE